MDTNGVIQRFLGKLALEDLLSAAVTLAVCLLTARLLLKLFRRLLGRTRLDARGRRYVLLVVKAVLYTLTAVFTFGSLGVNMDSLVALLSVGSLGITLAAEDVLGNMAGGLVLLSSHSFTAGDYIESGGVTGTVEEITLHHTRLTTPDGLTALLPNKELASSQVTNYTALGRRRVTWKFTASGSAPTAAVRAACLQGVEKTARVLPDPEPLVYLSGFKGGGVEYTVYCWTAAADYLAVYYALGENLRSALAVNGLDILCNQMDVHLKDK